MASLSQELARFVVQTRFEDLPEPVVHETKRILLDSVGCAIAGIATDKGTDIIQVESGYWSPAWYSEYTIIKSRDVFLKEVA